MRRTRACLPSRLWTQLGPQADSGEAEGGEVVSGELGVAGGNASVVLELAEAALDEVATAVEVWVYAPLEPTAAGRRDVCPGAGGLDQAKSGVGVVAAVGDDIGARGQVRQQGRDGAVVMGLPCGEGDAAWQAVLVHQDVELAAQPAAGASDGVVAPFLPPAACWWARMTELSIR